MFSSNSNDTVPASTEDSPDFSKPWELSDVVLVVEEEKFHVHRSMLAMWSPVFSAMFTSQFKEQTADEIPLPGKKAAEIKEMLLVIYPIFENQVHWRNFTFLLKLSKEYMMTKLTRKCERFLLGILGHAGELCTLLVIAQAFELKELEKRCIEKAKITGFDEIKRHYWYNRINLSTFRAIVEGKITEMERNLQDKNLEMDRLKSDVESLTSQAVEALKELEKISAMIAFGVGKTDSFSGEFDSTITCLRNSNKFKSLCGPLNSLHSKLEDISNQESY